MTDLNFGTIGKEALQQLEAERRRKVAAEGTALFVERENEENPIINELRFVYGYMQVGPFLIDPENGTKWELLVPFDQQQKTMEIAFIGVPAEKRRQGLGRSMMMQITAAADKYGYSLTLDIDPSFGIRRETLVAFYRSFGFVADGEWRDMKREPRTP